MRAFTLPLWLVQAGALSLFSAVAIAEVELPRSVPSAKLTQQVGLTEIAVEKNSTIIFPMPIELLDVFNAINENSIRKHQE